MLRALAVLPSWCPQWLAKRGVAIAPQTTLSDRLLTGLGAAGVSRPTGLRT
jgi:hypothetical protein